MESSQDLASEIFLRNTVRALVLYAFRPSTHSEGGKLGFVQKRHSWHVVYGNGTIVSLEYMPRDQAGKHDGGQNWEGWAKQLADADAVGLGSVLRRARDLLRENSVFVAADTAHTMPTYFSHTGYDIWMVTYRSSTSPGTVRRVSNLANVRPGHVNHEDLIRNGTAARRADSDSPKVAAVYNTYGEYWIYGRGGFCESL